MRLTLSATGIDSGRELFRVSVGQDGDWTYESRAVEHAQGRLTPADVAQFRGLYEAVDWDKHVLNAPVSADDRKLFRLEVDRGGGYHRIYQFSEAINHASYQFKDLVHFLRHNVATAGDPVGRQPVDPQDETRAQLTYE